MPTIRLDRALAALAAALGLAGLAEAQDVSASARYGSVTLKSDFRPDPHVVKVEAGGPDAASSLGSGCAGYISNERADFELTYDDPGRYSLGVYVVGADDTTLIINDPSGKWFCNDDFNARGGTNPGVVFANPVEGTYDIWVGAYDSDGTGSDVELYITETGAPWDPLFGTADLSANFNPDPYVTEIRAGGSDLAETLAQGCVGYVNAVRPDYGFNYSNAGQYTLSLFVEGAEDSTLVVKDPSGRWYCNDDYSAEGGHNPGVVLGDPVDGFYRVWVGTYSQDGLGEPVDLLVTELGSPWQTQSGGIGGSSDGVPPAGDGTELVASGTGFLVSRSGHILTNHHVVGECNRLTFQIRGDLVVEAETLAVNRTTDLALLKAPITTSVAAEFHSGSAVRLGEEVVVYGFPLFGDLSSQGNLTNGIVSALSGLDDDLSRMQMTAAIQPGNSGGPVMDRAGKIVGVVVETANDEYFRRERNTGTQNVNFAIRDSLARSFLDTNNVAYDVADASAAQMSVADIAEGAQKFTGIILCYQ